MADGKAKLTKALELMERRGLDCLVIYSRGTSFVLKPFPFYYFTEFRPMGRNSAAIVSASGEALVLLEGQSDAARAGRQSWVQDIRRTFDFPKDLRECLRQFAKKGIVGIAGSDEMTYQLYEGIRKDWTIAVADDVIEEMAREKNCHPSQLALAWVLAQGGDIVPIPGTKRRKYLEENVGALEVELNADDLRCLDEVFPSGAASGQRYPEHMLSLVNA